MNPSLPCPYTGLSLVVGLVLYISSINDEMLNRTKDAETYFNYKYGWSFAFAAISFLLTEVTCPILPCVTLVLPYLEGRRETSHSIPDHPPTILLFPRMYLSLTFLDLIYPGGSEDPFPSTHTLIVPLESSVTVSHEDTAGAGQQEPRSLLSVSFPLLLFHCRVLG